MTAPLRQVCSWCLEQGVLTVIQEGDEPTSHGACAYHAAGLILEYDAAAARPPQ